MTAQLLLCALCFLIGGVSRLCFVGVTVAERHVGAVAAFALDFLWGAGTVAALLCVIFVLSSGITMPYMLISALLGYAITAILI